MRTPNVTFIIAILIPLQRSSLLDKSFILGRWIVIFTNRDDKQGWASPERHVWSLLVANEKIIGNSDYYLDFHGIVPNHRKQLMVN